jgi:hypothetical protein
MGQYWNPASARLRPASFRESGSGQYPTPLSHGRYPRRTTSLEYRGRVSTGYGHEVDVHDAPNLAARLPGRMRARPGAQWGLAQDLPPAESVDLLTAVRAIYKDIVAIEPILQVVGRNPVLTLTLGMLAILGGSALGAYIGGSVKGLK